MQIRSKPTQETLLTEALMSLRLALNASEGDVVDAYRRCMLEASLDKVNGREKAQDINYAYMTLTGEPYANVVVLQEQIFNMRMETKPETVGEYLGKALAHRLDMASSNVDIDKEMDADKPGTFYFHVPICPSLSLRSSILVDPLDYITVVNESCKARYWKISSSKENALNNQEARFMTTDGYPFLCLQDGVMIYSGNSYAVPRIIPRFILYTIENITPRNLIKSLMSGDCLHLVPFITRYATNHTDRPSDDFLEKVLSFEKEHRAAWFAKANTQYSYNIFFGADEKEKQELNTLRKQARDALQAVYAEINAFLRQSGRLIPEGQSEQVYKANPGLVERTFSEVARRECISRIFASGNFWYRQSLEKLPTAVLLNSDPSCDNGEEFSSSIRMKR